MSHFDMAAIAVLVFAIGVFILMIIAVNRVSQDALNNLGGAALFNADTERLDWLQVTVAQGHVSEGACFWCTPWNPVRPLIFPRIFPREVRPQ